MLFSNFLTQVNDTVTNFTIKQKYGTVNMAFLLHFSFWKFSMLNIIMSYWAAISSSRLLYTYHKPFTKLSRLLCTHINNRYCSSHNGSDYFGVTLNWLQNRTGGLLNLTIYTMVQSFYVINYTMVMLVYKIGRSGWCSGLHASPAS